MHRNQMEIFLKRSENSMTVKKAETESNAPQVHFTLNGLWPQYDSQLITMTGRRQLHYMQGSKNLHKTGQSVFHCCWTMPVEEFTPQLIWFWAHCTGIPLAAEDAPV